MSEYFGTSIPAPIPAPTFNISGFKLNSSDNKGLPGWNIRLLNITTGLELANKTTDSTGFYNFTGLANGKYNVTEVMKQGWMNVTPTSLIVTITGTDATNKNFTNALIPPAPAPTFNISGFKLNGATGNGIEGWQISAENTTTGAPMFNTTTNAAGMYQILNLTNGTYTVVEETRAGFTPNGPTSQNITIAGHDVMNVNFTNTPVTPVKLGRISGTKFNDSDGDGIKDTNESGLTNWIITLSNSSTGAAIFNTTTANDGSYKFSNLPPGDYTVGEVLKSGWKQTTPLTGTYSVTITSAGEDITGKDFGNMLVPPLPPSVNGSISGNAINVATGMGIPNVTIKLVGIVGTGVDTKSIRMETMTDSMGKWMFDNLPAGRYIIIEQLPKGFIPVSPPVMNLMLAKGQNSMDNNFTVNPISALYPPGPVRAS